MHILLFEIFDFVGVEDMIVRVILSNDFALGGAELVGCLLSVHGVSLIFYIETV